MNFGTNSNCFSDYKITAEVEQLDGGRSTSVLKIETLIKLSRIRDFSRSTPPNCCATNLRLSGKFGTECLLEGVRCHLLFAIDFDRKEKSTWQISIDFSEQKNVPLKMLIHSCLMYGFHHSFSYG